MRLTLTSGETTVDLRTDPGEGVSLRAAENSVLRLFRALPKADEPSGEQPFGFSISSDTERAPEPEPTGDDDDE
jgi:hypothetical protein